ncbi:type I methionyl aminopeptidase [Saxibacter everestensis]|uniref:Methionine aminopeptidase n=1 Tax=Saxibacter everestensis TaxID=2909229 RepID=A0ABY8QYH9_9MICO|nr:type I methionyl aminopeptidase [Brevibacteriaceae bacterium ZFBP1038]
MREAGLVTAAALGAARDALTPGITTRELDAIAAAVIKDAGATSNFKGYHGFPATLCISVNDEVVHGIPGDRKIAPGDLVSIDGGAIVSGWHGDSAFSAVVDPVDSENQRLIDITEQAMWVGIAALASARHVGEIGAAIDDFVTASAADFGILEDYVGHGIGTSMHQPPDVLNYRASNLGPKVKPGLCLAIEPMLVAGDIATRVLDDDWTVVTEDKRNAAHWEHSVAVHDGGIWVLTAPDGGAAKLAELGVTVAPLD